jgi:membrane-associated phospholipid phosphatase
MSLMGEGWVIVTAGLFISTCLFFAGRYRAAQVAVLAVALGLLTGASATILRSLVGRTRPSAHAPQGVYGVWRDSRCIIGQYDYGSFPSGHAATAAGLVAALWRRNRKLGLAAVPYAALVSWSRLAQGCHHFSDIVAASLLGIVGAQILSQYLGPLVDSAGQRLQAAWLRRRQLALPSEAKPQALPQSKKLWASD